jgi:hypothetical protein
MKKCLTNKNSYENENEAKKAAILGMFLKKGINLKLNTYFCMICYNYHLTSSKKKK